MLDRRSFLNGFGLGLGGIALNEMLAAESRGASTVDHGVLSGTHFAPKAKHVIQLFMPGGPSQVDTFDPKPALARHDGEPYTGDAKVGSNGRPIGHLMKSPFEFTRHGKSGLEISSLFPNTAQHADDLCVIRSMHADTAAHASGCLQMNTGSIFIGRPSVGAWLSYGLGSMTEELPTFVVLPDPRAAAQAAQAASSSSSSPSTSAASPSRAQPPVAAPEPPADRGGSSEWLLWVAIGVGALVLLGGTVAAAMLLGG